MCCARRAPRANADRDRGFHAGAGVIGPTGKSVKLGFFGSLMRSTKWATPGIRRGVARITDLKRPTIVVGVQPAGRTFLTRR